MITVLAWLMWYFDGSNDNNRALEDLILLNLYIDVLNTISLKRTTYGLMYRDFNLFQKLIDSMLLIYSEHKYCTGPHTVAIVKK